MKKKKRQRIVLILQSVIIYSIILPVASVFAQPDYPAIDTTRLVANYEFDGSFRDLTGHNADAIPHDAYLTDNQYCVPLSALNLSGQASFLEVADHPSLDFTDTFSVSFSVFLDSLPETETRIISKADPSDPSTASYWLSIYPGEAINYGTEWSFSLVDISGIVHTCKAEWGLLIKSWVQFTITFDGATLSLLLGPELVADFELGPVEMESNDYPLLFGNASGSGITGKIDDIRIYERIVSGQEIYDYDYQFWIQADDERPTILACSGEEVELVCSTSGIFLQYTFYKDGEILQNGTDSICRVLVQTEADFGEFSCKAFNCVDSHTKYFDVEQIGTGNEIVIIDQPYFFSAYKNGSASMRFTLDGKTENTSYRWVHNGITLEETRSKLGIRDITEADTGFYYCEITDHCSRVISDSIHLTFLQAYDYPQLDTSGLVAYYPFNGSYIDSIGNTGPAADYLMASDSGMYCTLNRAVRFTGLGSYLEIPEDPDLDIREEITIVLSLRVDSVPDSKMSILTKSLTPGQTPGNYGLYIGPDMKLTFEFSSDNGTVYEVATSEVLQPGKWHLFTASYDGVELNTYLDGNQGIPIVAEDIVMQTNDQPVILGSWPNKSNYMVLDELRIFNRALGFDEIISFMLMHRPKFHKGFYPVSACEGDTVLFDADASGPELKYKFLKDGILLQGGDQSNYKLYINSASDYGEYEWTVSNNYWTSSANFPVEPLPHIENIFIRDVFETRIYFEESESVTFNFEASHYVLELDYEMYHNGVLLTNNYRGSYTIDYAVPSDSGTYYYVIINGCERIVSDTIHLIMVDGQNLKENAPVGWDWTSTIKGSGDSYFSSICTDENESFYLLGHFGGGLMIGDVESISTGADDIFIIKYSEDGNLQWSRIISGQSFKGKGDLDVDVDGNVYVTGSYSGILQIEDQMLTSVEQASGYLAKYDPDGNLLWIKLLETSKWINCDNIEINADNQIYLGGNFHESFFIDEKEVTGTWNQYARIMFLAKLDSVGNCLWISHAEIDQDGFVGQLIDMDLSNSGDVITCGTFSYEVDFGNGVKLSTMIEAPFLVKYNEDGVAQWGSASSAEFGFAEAFDVSVDDSNRIFMTGMYLADMTVDSFSIGKAGDFMEEIFQTRESW